MSAYSTGKHWLQKINRGVAFLGMLALLPMMLLTSSEVASRAIWNRPIPGAVEMSSYLLAFFILLGIGYTQQVKGHVRVTMLSSRLGEKPEAFLGVCTTLFSLFVIALLAWQGWVLGMEETAVSDMLRIPQMPFKMLVSLAGGLLFMELLFDLVDDLAKLVRR